VANPVISGIVRDKDGNIITGVQCNIDVYDKDDRSLRILAIKTDGTLWAWGYITYRSSPVQVGSLTNWVDVAAGRDHTIAIQIQ